jgi:hypothetical protein
MDYDDFSLRFAADGPHGVQIAAECKRGEAAAPFVPPAAAPRGRRLGAQLFDGVMSPPVRSLFDESLAAAAVAGRGLRIRLFFNRREPRLAAVSQLPWELLYRSDREAFLALDTATPIVRHLALPQPTRPAPLASPLRVLVMTADVAGLPRLAVADEQRALAGLADRRPPATLALRAVERPTRDALRRALLAPLDIFHFIGHGGFDVAAGEGYLALEREPTAEAPPARDLHTASSRPAGAGSAAARSTFEPLRGEVLANLLTGRGGPRLAVLNACSTGESAGAQDRPPFGGVAAALVLGGVPAVVAMQERIGDRAAWRWSAALYERIAEGDALEEAVAEARRAVYAADPQGFEWSIPALFLRLESGQLFACPAVRHDGEGGEERQAPPAAAQRAPREVNRVDLNARVVGGSVDLAGWAADAGAGTAGAAGSAGGVSNSVVARFDEVHGNVTAAGKRTGRAGRDDG